MNSVKVSSLFVILIGIEVYSKGTPGRHILYHTRLPSTFSTYGKMQLKVSLRRWAVDGEGLNCETSKGRKQAYHGDQWPHGGGGRRRGKEGRGERNIADSEWGRRLVHCLKFGVSLMGHKLLGRLDRPEIIGCLVDMPLPSLSSSSSSG